MSQSRKLAAIMFTDIVGYTALMGADEQKAFQLLKKNREIQKPLIKHYNGTWIKELGDGVLASFHTVTDAVFCAAAIHKGCDMVEGLKLRIGIHLGEVVFEDRDVFGDGVNIASRLQSIADPGEILVSEAVYTNIKNKKEFTAVFIREETLKNVESPVKSYRIRIDPDSNTTSSADPYPKSIHLKRKLFNEKKIIPFILGLIILLTAGFFFYFKNEDKSKGKEKVELKSTDKSIVVLPFKNMTNDSTQDYFADAIMNEILNHLYKIGGWRVIPYTSAMSYKDSRKTVKEIAHDLGVTNVLEGNVQMEKNRIRIGVKLIDGKTEEYLWTDTYDREFNAVFAIQSEIAQRVATELKINIDPDVKQRIEALPTKSMEAYTIYLQAKNKPENSSRMALERAIRLDSNFAEAYAELAYYWLLQGVWHGELRSEQVLEKATPLLQNALQINPDLASAHYHKATLLLWYRWDFEAVENEYEKMLQLYPSNTEVSSEFHDYLISTGRFEEALRFALINFDNDQNNWGNLVRLAFAYHFNNQPDKALAKIELAESMFPDLNFLKLLSIRIYVYNNRFERAIQTFDRIPDSLHKFKFHAHNLSHIAIAYYKTGQTNKGDSFLNDLERKSQQTPVGSPNYYLAAVYAALGQPDRAIQSLEKAFSDHEVEMYQLKVWPLFIPLRNDKRFQDIVTRIDYP